MRGIGRPRYGYYLDHLVDAVATAMIGIGLGPLAATCCCPSARCSSSRYLVLSINVYLESQALGRFSIGYGKLGPTEARILLIALNTALALGLTPHVSIAGLGIGVLDVVGIGLAAGMLGALAVRARGNLRELAKLEPGRLGATLARLSDKAPQASLPWRENLQEGDQVTIAPDVKSQDVTTEELLERARALRPIFSEKIEETERLTHISGGPARAAAGGRLLPAADAQALRRATRSTCRPT